MSLIRLRNDFGSAVITPDAGAALRSLCVKVGDTEHELLAGASLGAGTFDESQTPQGAGSFIMAPWVNRIHLGKLVTDHGEFELPVDSGEHAIHGTVRHRKWDVITATESSVELRIELQSPWPFAGYVVSKVSLEGPSLKQTLEVHAAEGERVSPAGVGWHPWFKRSLGGAELQVQADVAKQWELDAKVVPTGVAEETDGTRKLRSGGKFGVGEVDGCFLLKEGGAAEVRWPELTLRMTSSPEINHVMVYSPAGAVCVEPQTTTVNAFQLAARGIADTGTRTVSPGNPLSATTVWSWA